MSVLFNHACRYELFDRNPIYLVHPPHTTTGVATASSNPSLQCAACLHGSPTALDTFSFLMLLYFPVFSVVSARERHWFWATLPSKTLLTALAVDAVTGTLLLTFVGLPGLKPLPYWQTLAVFAYALVACLGVNDAVKVAIIKWRVPNAVANKPVDVTPQIAKPAYELYEQRGRRGW